MGMKLEFLTDETRVSPDETRVSPDETRVSPDETLGASYPLVNYH